MTDEEQRAYLRHRETYRRSILAHERAEAALTVAEEARNAAFRAMQDASATFHEFCDAQARKEDA